MGVSGISSGFPGLSQTWGQVAHVLLTRSPLALHQYCYRMVPARLACIKHAASVRPEPGSNSPSKPLPSQRAGDDSCEEPAFAGRPKTSDTADWLRRDVVRLRYDITIRRRGPRTRPATAGSPALTFEPSVPFSRCNRCVRDTGRRPAVRPHCPAPPHGATGGGSRTGACGHATSTGPLRGEGRTYLTGPMVSNKPAAPNRARDTTKSGG